MTLIILKFKYNMTSPNNTTMTKEIVMYMIYYEPVRSNRHFVHINTRDGTHLVENITREFTDDSLVQTYATSLMNEAIDAGYALIHQEVLGSQT